MFWLGTVGSEFWRRGRKRSIPAAGKAASLNCGMEGRPIASQPFWKIGWCVAPSEITGSMVTSIMQSIRDVRGYLRLPETARAEHRRDRLGLPIRDPGTERAIEEGIAWLCRAQDHSASQDGGVARDFSLVTGWSTSYPETTGFIVPTLLAYAKLRRDETMRQRAKRMLDWLVSIQFPDGGFQGGAIGCKPVVPVAFNTGMILPGLASGV